MQPSALDCATFACSQQLQLQGAENSRKVSKIGTGGHRIAELQARETRTVETLHEQ